MNPPISQCEGHRRDFGDRQDVLRCAPFVEGVYTGSEGKPCAVINIADRVRNATGASDAGDTNDPPDHQEEKDRSLEISVLALGVIEFESAPAPVLDKDDGGNQKSWDAKDHVGGPNAVARIPRDV
mmetsp:Transcript_2305/g.4949  ORF Transcript_2305/g.4949 Transcript_2305/m.4949 type:complete len:126 (-) Transcript_2305:234-611(-)